MDESDSFDVLILGHNALVPEVTLTVISKYALLDSKAGRARGKKLGLRGNHVDYLSHHGS